MLPVDTCSVIVYSARTCQSLSNALKVAWEHVSFSFRQVNHFSHFLERKKTGKILSTRTMSQLSKLYLICFPPQQSLVQIAQVSSSWLFYVLSQLFRIDYYGIIILQTCFKHYKICLAEAFFKICLMSYQKINLTNSIV